MTAEIAVLNAHGVAMAADSAVSIGASKVYNSALKLFALTKKEPVGIMIYGNARIMSVPWESLIKTYRKQLKNTKFSTLGEYGTDFIKYLTKTTHIGSENEDVYVTNRISSLIFGMKTKILEEDLPKFWQNNPKRAEAEVHAHIASLIKKYSNEVIMKERLSDADDKWVNRIKKKITPIVHNAIKDQFENIPIPKTHQDLIFEACASMFYANRYSNNGQSGIVISGFGDSEIYPSLISYEIEWRLMGVLKYSVIKKEKISVHNDASIVPFAQREMVDTFMRGAEPELMNSIMQEVGSILDNIIDNAFKGTKTVVSKKNLPIIKKNCEAIKDDLQKKVVNAQNNNFINPVLDSVAALPLDELSSMARTLINMTSFKRKVSLNRESVGGPIDVAVISKGDGFIWINRKHYFEAELNQHYVSNNS